LLLSFSYAVAVVIDEMVKVADSEELKTTPTTVENLTSIVIASNDTKNDEEAEDCTPCSFNTVSNCR